MFAYINGCGNGIRVRWITPYDEGKIADIGDEWFAGNYTVWQSDTVPVPEKMVGSGGLRESGGWCRRCGCLRRQETKSPFKWPCLNWMDWTNGYCASYKKCCHTGYYGFNCPRFMWKHICIYTRIHFMSFLGSEMTDTGIINLPHGPQWSSLDWSIFWLMRLLQDSRFHRPNGRLAGFGMIFWRNILMREIKFIFWGGEGGLYL